MGNKKKLDDIPFEIHRADEDEGYSPGSIVELSPTLDTNIQSSTTPKKPLARPLQQERVIEFTDASLGETIRQHSSKQLSRDLHTRYASHTSHTSHTSHQSSILRKARQVGKLAAGTLLAGFLLYSGGRAIFSTSDSTSRPDKELFTRVAENFLPEGAVVGLVTDKDTTYFYEKDAFMRNLSAQKAYVDDSLLTVDTNIMNKTISLVNHLSFDELMKTTGLNGMYKMYTGFATEKTDFDFAMNFMWTRKVAKMNGRFAGLATIWAQAYDQKTTSKSNLQEFKKTLGETLDDMLSSLDKHDYYGIGDSAATKDGMISIAFHDEKKRFLDNYMNNLNENILVAYTLTELFPDINPAFNLASFDKLLKEAGPEFIYNIPALGDSWLSHGPFQFTSQIIQPNGAPSLNQYFSDNFCIPASMEDYDTPEEHNRAAVMTIIYNAELLANKLYTAGEIKNFNDNFEALSKREQEIFIAGQASAAHHYSSTSASTVRDYQMAVTAGKKDFKDIISTIEYTKGDYYYDQSIRNYLVLDALENQKKKK
ncbi:hypothetical protein K9M74_01810 [Candidatus Woesearchaeota archaeon]|nr:hypothetical protein [Candidatus Woesearchaeota archaeon]